nr:hypothetical protein [Tanacetum cinerariifolium]
MSLSLLSRDPRGMSLLHYHLSFHLHLVFPHLGFLDYRQFFSDSVRLFPFGQPYHTYPNGLRKLLTKRKRIRPFYVHRLAWRHVSHHSLDRHSSSAFTSNSSSSSSSADSLSYISSGSSLDSLSKSSLVHSLGCDALCQSYSGPSTRVASPRPSRKRFGSLTTLVPSSTPVLRLIAPALADLLPRKWFRDLYSSKASEEYDMGIGTIDVETIPDLGINDRVGAPTEDGIGMGVESTYGDALDLQGTIYDISHYRSEVLLDRITEFETTQRQLEAGPLMASEERANLTDRISIIGRENLRVQDLIHRDHDDTQRRLRRLESLVKRTMTNTHSGMTPTAIGEMMNRRMAKPIETIEANKNIRLGNGNDEGGKRK